MFDLTRWQAIQLRAWPWLTLTGVLAGELFVDAVTTYLSVPGNGMLAVVLTALAVLALLVLLTYFVLRPGSRVGWSATLGLISSVDLAVLYGFLMVARVAQVIALFHSSLAR